MNTYEKKHCANERATFRETGVSRMRIPEKRNYGQALNTLETYLRDITLSLRRFLSR